MDAWLDRLSENGLALHHERQDEIEVALWFVHALRRNAAQFQFGQISDAVVPQVFFLGAPEAASSEKRTRARRQAQYYRHPRQWSQVMLPWHLRMHMPAPVLRQLLETAFREIPMECQDSSAEVPAPLFVYGMSSQVWWRMRPPHLCVPAADDEMERRAYDAFRQ